MGNTTADGSGDRYDTSDSNSGYGNFGLSKPERKVSWQLLAFIALVILGIAILVARFML